MNIPKSTSRSKEFTYKVNDCKALLPIGFETKTYNRELYFKVKNDAREYLLVNYLIEKNHGILSNIFEYNTGRTVDAHYKEGTEYEDITTLTVVQRNYHKKHEMIAHYVMKKVSQTAIVFYSCDSSGKGSTDRKHWKPIKRVTKENNNKRKRSTL